MTKFGTRVLFFCVLFVGLLPTTGCADRPPETLPIAEYEISEETFWYRNAMCFQNKNCNCSDMVPPSARRLEPGVRVINTGREADCRNKVNAKGGLMLSYLIEVEKLSERGQLIWVPEDVLVGK